MARTIYKSPLAQAESLSGPRFAEVGDYPYNFREETNPVSGLTDVYFDDGEYSGKATITPGVKKESPFKNRVYDLIVNKGGTGIYSGNSGVIPEKHKAFFDKFLKDVDDYAHYKKWEWQDKPLLRPIKKSYQYGKLQVSTRPER